MFCDIRECIDGHEVVAHYVEIIFWLSFRER